MWYEKYSGPEITNEGLVELAKVLRNQIDLHERFLRQWQELGYHEDAKDYWSKELVAIQLRTDAFKKMLDGINKQDYYLYESGITLYEQSQEKGLIAEDASKALSALCTK